MWRTFYLPGKKSGYFCSLIFCYNIEGKIKTDEEYIIKKHRMDDMASARENIRKILIALFVVSVIVLFILIYFVPGVSEKLTATSIVQYDKFQVTDNIDCYFVRDETVFFADGSGLIKYNAKEGERVAKGSEVLRINRENINASGTDLKNVMQRIEMFGSGKSLFADDVKKLDSIIEALNSELNEEKKKGNTQQVKEIQSKIERLKAKKQLINSSTGAGSTVYAAETGNEPSSIAAGSELIYNSKYSGIVSYYIDGYETEFAPQNLRILNREKVEQFNMDVANTYRERALKGEPVFKIVKSNIWYAVAWIDKNKIVKYKKGNPIKLNLPLGQTSGTIYDIIEDNGRFLIILKFTRYYPDFAKIRKINADIVTEDYEGLKISNKSLVSKNGQAGVYVLNLDGEFVFKPVKIIGTNGEYSFVESGCFYEEGPGGMKKIDTVNLYDEIMNDPSGKSEPEKKKEENGNESNQE